ncbi:hypothetical protein J437_LFUL016036 [Ladona fulva]|uniref:Uncharacterized protein n=1 Tax=Ladona fulva TaxID=123851 RepID=A0A8K0KNW0_LADFU|nr:hypothetical protein J437_LFUL016036 [Ladona fulva]
MMMDCKEEFVDMSLKVDSLENAMLEIQKETSSQHTKLKELKDRHAKLKERLQVKDSELQDRRAKSTAISEELKLKEFRVKESKETYETELEVTEASRSEVRKIQDKLQIERDNQIESLKCYERRMADLAQCFRQGPLHYDRKNMTKKIRQLDQISTGIQKDIEKNENKLKKLTNSFSKLASEGAVFTSNSFFLMKLLEEDMKNIKLKISFLQRVYERLEKLIADQKNSELKSNIAQNADE